jgi:Sec-independent protein translocase protein TatA
MLGISFSEFIVILLALFLIVGPRRLSGSMQGIGAWVRKFRTEIYHFKESQLRDVDMSPFYEAKTELNKSLNDLSDKHSV